MSTPLTISLNLPMVVSMGDDAHSFIETLKKIAVFNPPSEEKSVSKKKLAVLDWIDVGEIIDESYTYFLYSPQKAGKKLKIGDDEVAFAILDFQQKLYKDNPNYFIPHDDLKRYKQKGSIPKWVTWEFLIEVLWDLPDSISEKQFDNWLFTRQAQQQKDMLLKALDQTVATETNNVLLSPKRPSKRKM